MIKQLLDSVFVISRIIKGLGKGYRPQTSASADNPKLDLDYFVSILTSNEVVDDKDDDDDNDNNFIYMSIEM